MPQVQIEKRPTPCVGELRKKIFRPKTWLNTWRDVAFSVQNEDMFWLAFWAGHRGITIRELGRRLGREGKPVEPNDVLKFFRARKPTKIKAIARALNVAPGPPPPVDDEAALLTYVLEPLSVLDGAPQAYALFIRMALGLAQELYQEKLEAGLDAPFPRMKRLSDRENREVREAFHSTLRTFYRNYFSE